MCPSSEYGHATHLLGAENALSSHLISILGDCGFGGGNVRCLLVAFYVEFCFDIVGVSWWCSDSECTHAA